MARDEVKDKKPSPQKLHRHLQNLEVKKLFAHRGKVSSLPKPMTPQKQKDYDKRVEEWQDRAERHDPEIQGAKEEEAGIENWRQVVKSVRERRDDPNAAPEARQAAAEALENASYGGSAARRMQERKERSDPSR